jgi:DNA-binding GntR family transcriptional regulator
MSGIGPVATGAPPSDQEIHRRIVEAIVDQRLPPGTKLVEDKLGQAFGVSRTRIRQVIVRLAAEQVVTLHANKGAVVAEPTVAEAREVFEARRVVEAVLVRRFTAAAGAADLQALADCIAIEEAARRRGDVALALRHSGRFHLLLAAAAGHATFAQFLQQLVSRTSLILMSYAPADPARPARPRSPAVWVPSCRCDEHRGLVDALRRAMHDPAAAEAAVQAMTAHLHRLEAGLCFNQAAPERVDLMAALGLP